jgi:hypothetical protein
MPRMRGSDMGTSNRGCSSVSKGEGESVDTLREGGDGEVSATNDCKSTNGYWKCLTCGTGVPNNITANGHADDGHEVRWMCLDHDELEDTYL